MVHLRTGVGRSRLQPDSPPAPTSALAATNAALDSASNPLSSSPVAPADDAEPPPWAVTATRRVVTGGAGGLQGASGGNGTQAPLDEMEQALPPWCVCMTGH